MGGPNVLQAGSTFQRTYTSLPSHSYLIYFIRVIRINAWTSSDSFTVRIDSQTLPTFDTSINGYTIGSNICGQGNNDVLHYYLIGKIAHSSAQITLKFQTNVVSTGASMGFREIDLAFGISPTPFTDWTCQKFQGDSPSPCGCGFQTSTVPFACNFCHEACRTCLGDGPGVCFGCSSGFTFDGTQCVQCASNCQLCSGTSSNQCMHCNNGYILTLDNTCVATCPDHYVVDGDGDFKMCKTPCQPDNYMLWDYTCTDLCTSPFSSSVKNGAKFCNYPCNTAANEVLYYDGSCSSSCDLSLSNINGYQFCRVCQSGYFMYQDGSCLASCPSPFTQINNIVFHFCNLPCPSGVNYYSYEQSKCLSDCSYPYKANPGGICVLDVSPSDIQQAATISGGMNAGGTAMAAASTGVGMINFADPDAFNMVNMQKMLKYIRFMKISYSPKLQAILDKQDSDGFARYLPDVPKDIYNNLPRHTLPEKFEKYKIHSSFLVNFWIPLIELIFMLVVIALVCLINYCTVKFKHVHTVCYRIKNVLKWNLALMIFTTFYGDIVLFTSLEMRTTALDHLAPICSFVICLGINLLSILVFIRLISVIGARRKQNRERQQSAETNSSEDGAQWKAYQVLFSTYKDRLFIEQAFLPLFISRIYLFNVVIAYCFELPLIQAILIAALNFLMLLYLGAKRPIKDKIVLFKYLAQELTLFVINLCILISAILDAAKSRNTVARGRLGNVIITGNMIFTMIGLVYIGVIITIIIKDAFLAIKNRNRRNKDSTSDANQGEATQSNSLQGEASSAAETTMQRQTNDSTVGLRTPDEIKSSTKRNLGYRIKPRTLSKNKQPNNIEDSDISNTQLDDTSNQKSFRSGLFGINPADCSMSWTENEESNRRPIYLENMQKLRENGSTSDAFGIGKARNLSSFSNPNKTLNIHSFSGTNNSNEGNEVEISPTIGNKRRADFDTQVDQTEVNMSSESNITNTRVSGINLIKSRLPFKFRDIMLEIMKRKEGMDEKNQGIILPENCTNEQGSYTSPKCFNRE